MCMYPMDGKFSVEFTIWWFGRLTDEHVKLKSAGTVQCLVATWDGYNIIPQIALCSVDCVRGVAHTDIITKIEL